MVGVGQLGDSLNKRKIASGMLFCRVELSDGNNHLEVCQFSVDVFDWSKPMFIQLGICAYGEHWSDASSPNYF